MTFSIAYWVLMLVWLVLGVWSALPNYRANYKATSGNIILFILLLLVGWQVFGPPIHR